MMSLQTRATTASRISYVAGANPEAAKVLTDLITYADDASTRWAQAHPQATRKPDFAEQVLQALTTQNDLTGQQFLDLHQRVCGSNPTGTFAVLVMNFQERRGNIAEVLRRMNEGLHARTTLSPAADFASLVGFHGAEFLPRGYTMPVDSVLPAPTRGDPEFRHPGYRSSDPARTSSAHTHTDEFVGPPRPSRRTASPAHA